MYQLLKKGQTVELSTGNNCTVKDFFGSGTQGEVYKVESGSDTYALKWYFPASATAEQKSIIQNLLKKGSPNNKFLWPLALAHHDKSSSFGYLMPVRPNNYVSINMLMKRKAEPTFYALVTACYNLADSFFQLHSEGFAYKDISFGNAFIDPLTGDVLICDNDNACYDGQNLSAIGGTPRFMAPEIVRGQAMPSKYTDLFSLGILLFYMLYLSHPLMGKKELKIHALDDAALKQLFGIDPLFIFDPVNNSNAPDTHEHQNAIIFWKIYPKFINDLFTKLFTKGLTDTHNGRVEESVWRSSFIILRDSLVYCSKCGAENFYDIEKAKEKQSLICWNDKCRNELKLPFRMKINKQIMMLNHNTKLFPHHTRNKHYDFSAPSAEVVIHPEKKIWGLKNLSNENWVLTANEKIQTIEKGKTVTLNNGYKINFGSVEGEIRF